MIPASFMPAICDKKRAELLCGWRHAVKCALYYAEQSVRRGGMIEIERYKTIL